MGESLLVALGVLAVVAIAIWGYYRNIQRRKALVAWTQGKGLSFDPSRDREMDSRFPGFGCLAQGSDRYAHNRMSGEWRGRPFLGFDYHYETHSTDSKGHGRTHHHHFSAVILESGVPLEPLFIRPEGIFDKLTEFVGFDDIDFESTEFSHRFYVKAANRRWAYDVLHQRTMEFLLQAPRFTIQSDESHVIAYRASQFSVAEFEAAAEVICGILDRLPDYLLQQRLEERAS